VVTADRFPTGATRLAHMVLPTSAFTEIDGTVTSACGIVQRWRRIVASPGDAVSERVWAERVGARMSLSDWPKDPSDWFGRLQTGVSAYSLPGLKRLYESENATGVKLWDKTTLSWTPPGPPQVPAKTGDFPFWLAFETHASQWSTGTLSEREELLHREVKHSIIYLSPDDMKQAGLRNGQAARVTTPQRAVTMVAREDRCLPAGVSLAVPLAGSDGAALRGFYPDPASPVHYTQPVPMRIEKLS
jgi:assimilatory nitrate reductase catalytic subunit